MAERASRSQRERRRRTPRIRVACSRCHKRKIRCDAATPSCNACSKARALCVYNGDMSEARRNLLNPTAGDMDSPSPVMSIAGDQESDQPLAETATRTQEEARNASTAKEQLATPTYGEGHQQPDFSGAPSGPPSPEDPPTHPVGLVSLSVGTDPKYIGSSSGYFFAQLLKSARGRENKPPDDIQATVAFRQQEERDMAIRAFQNIPTSLPATASLTSELSKVYFDTVHLQYPFLHEPTHRRLVQEVFEGSSKDKVATFQVTLVLSISALILSRRTHVELPAAGWCAKTMENFGSLQAENSLRGLQCLLLLIIYAMHSPASDFNAWHLNYQCIAMVIDLGLQRELPMTSSLSPLQKEMRARIFWVVYSLDRKLCTMMGRPVGFRDEAYDQRLPAKLEGESLASLGILDGLPGDTTSHMDFAIHFIELAKMNSELKYVLHSVNRETPSWAYPAVRDIFEWQRSMDTRLAEWHATIPSASPGNSDYGPMLCKTSYHTMRMLLFLPTPGIPHPGPESLQACYDCSISAIRLFREMYEKDMLVYDWSTCHAVILHAFCLVYCATAVPKISAETTLDSFLGNVRTASDILSATSEYWTGAKRARDLLNAVASKALQRIVGSASMSTRVNPAWSSEQQTNPQDQQSAWDTSSANQYTIGDSDGLQNIEIPSDFNWESQETLPLMSLFDDFQSGFDFAGNDFDIGNIFIDAIDFNGSGNETQDSRFRV